jgi:glycosyltransferase involved in cell wall biosynthesis
MDEDHQVMTAPIVIAHIIASNFYGGPEKQILTHARCLDSERFRFVLVSFVERDAPNEILERASHAGIATVQLPVGHPFDPRAILRLREILKELGADLVCSHGYKANVLGRLATWSCGIPQIAISRGWTAESRKIRVYETLDKFFLRLDDHVVAVSHGQKEKIQRLGLRKSLSVIHNAISISENLPQQHGCVRSELGIPGGALLVASAGRLSPEKNYAGMIEVAAKICALRDDVFFAVFGEGFLRQELEQRIDRLGLGGRFLLPGFRRDMPEVFKQLDVFMLPSFTEGLPNVALEAFAAQKPILATAVGGTPEVVQHGVSGFLTTPLEFDLMAKHLFALLDDPDLRQRFGQAGHDYIKEHFSFASQTAAYERLYLALAGS